MTRNGWSRLIPDEGTFHGSDEFRIAAYSEFMPPPRVGWKPYGPVPVNSYLLSPDDGFGWKVHEFDEALELQPGLQQIARQLLARLKRLQDGNPDTGLPRHISRNNPFWPAELAGANLQNDRCVLLLPLALSRTQDDKGRVRWTLFGNSEQGPGKAFWKSFFTAPGIESAGGGRYRLFLSLVACGLWRERRGRRWIAPGRISHPSRMTSRIFRSGMKANCPRGPVAPLPRW